MYKFSVLTGLKMETIQRIFLYEIPNLVWQFINAPIRCNNSRIAIELRKKLYRTPCVIDTNVFITNIKNLEAGPGSALYHSCYILNSNGKFVIGNDSHLGAFCYVNAHHGNVIIGNNVAIGPGTKIFSYSNHYLFGKKVTDVKITKDVLIKNNVFIGANCIILPGTVIQDNVVIGAGSVIKGELQSNSIYGGVPCKELRAGWYE